jgi:hypothetical protein
MEFINKKWDLPTMEKKLDSLKKIIPEYVVDLEISLYSNVAEDRLDVLYLAYYSLKDKYCKVKREKFGKIKDVEFQPRKNVNSSTGNYWWSPADYTWTVTPSSGNSLFTYADYNTYTTTGTWYFNDTSI